MGGGLLEAIPFLPEERRFAAEPDGRGLLVGRRPLAAPGIAVRLTEPAPEGVGVTPPIPGNLAGRERETPGATPAGVDEYFPSDVALLTDAITGRSVGGPLI